MSLLRIFCPLPDPPQRCQWALVSGSDEAVTGEGLLAQLPRGADRVQLVISAVQVLITRAKLPRSNGRRPGALLAYAVEDKTLGEPDANCVSWLGAVDGNDVLAVVDRVGLERWRNALDAAGVGGYEVHCETLLLPWAAGEWSLAWNGRDGFIRTGEFEGAATDVGDREAPPLSLRLMLEEAKEQGAAPLAISLYTTERGAAPDIEAWARELGIAVRLAGSSDWRTAPAGAGISLAQERQRWLGFTRLGARLRPAAWILGAALAVHAAALVIERTSLANEQRVLRQQMEGRFRALFPDAVAVVDPALQMRPKLAEARHAAGQSDSGDFLPLIERIAAGTKELPAGALRALSYEGGRVTLELSGVDEASTRRIVARMLQSGLIVHAAPARSAGGKLVLTVRAS